MPQRSEVFLLRDRSVEMNARLGIHRIEVGRRSSSRTGGSRAGAWSVYVFTDGSPPPLALLFVRRSLGRFVFPGATASHDIHSFFVFLLFAFCLQVCASLCTLFW
jgi:hypothetical protein